MKTKYFALAVLTLLPTTATADGDVIKARLLKMMDANRTTFQANFGCGSIQWTQHAKQDAFDLEGVHIEETETNGVFQLWWDGEKVATRYTRDSIHTYPDGSWSIEKTGQRTAFDGKEFRRAENAANPKRVDTSLKPKYRPEENWFRMTWFRYPGWTWRTDFERIENLKDCSVSWSVVVFEGRKHARLEWKMAKDSRATKWRGIKLFDLERGGELVREDNYISGRPKWRQTRVIKKVGNDVWFPAEKVVEFLNPKTGKVTSRHRYLLDMRASSFNDRASIPNDVFHLPSFKVLDDRK
ncbi:MAG: hypothetical protein HOL01_05450 [Planctomycetaceae bacterium]|jgi:hypothetical protein|nr:hypothetical protein [Planctomycetaceae bacterium]MBT6483947.1 hypothetical protein [Planctomycetaceae bacterium]MBT6493980.1 hypothetical protein [Planctomycetaceae bacterium]